MGQVAQFKCESNTTRHWTFEDAILPSNVEVSGDNHHTLTIFNVQIKNRGTYKCITKDDGEREHILEGVLHVINSKTHINFY